MTECDDAVGIITKVTHVCFEHRLNIVRQDQFASTEDCRFFMRTVLDGDFAASPSFVDDVRAVLPGGARVTLKDGRRRRLMVLVTREAHVLGDLLIKCYSGALNAEVAAVAGNHGDLSDLCERFGVPFHLVSCEGVSRDEQERRMMECIDTVNADYVVLAKYMRILSPRMVAHYPLGRLINIHHSFLPAFMGARPYEQAFHRGVKIIGATAHFVTDNLDEGPIIEQDVIKVNHRYDAATMAKAGHDVEQMVLLRAMQRILDDKVFIHGNKTVVF